MVRVEHSSVPAVETLKQSKYALVDEDKSVSFESGGISGVERACECPSPKALACRSESSSVPALPNIYHLLPLQIIHQACVLLDSAVNGRTLN